MENSAREMPESQSRTPPRRYDVEKSTPDKVKSHLRFRNAIAVDPASNLSHTVKVFRAETSIKPYRSALRSAERLPSDYALSIEEKLGSLQETPGIVGPGNLKGTLYRYT